MAYALQPSSKSTPYSLLRKPIGKKETVKNPDNYTNAFSAIAELVDNAFYSNATMVEIDMVEHRPSKSFRLVDNGDGMSREEVLNIKKQGCQKDTPHGFGNNFCFAGLHLAHNILLLSKKERVFTFMLIHSSFDGRPDEVLCTSVAEDRVREYNNLHFLSDEDEYELCKEHNSIKIFLMERGITLDELCRNIRGSHGTMIALFSMRTSCYLFPKKNDLELRPFNAPRSSLRDFLAKLYLWPKMEIRLCRQPVVPRKIIGSWVERKWSQVVKIDTVNLQLLHQLYTSEITRLRNDQTEASSEASAPDASYDERISNRTLANQIGLNVAQHQSKIDAIEVAKENGFMAYLGMEVRDREDFGVHLYVNNRLVMWGFKPSFFKGDHPHLKGMSLYCNLSSEAFPLTLNKEELLHPQDFKDLEKSLNTRLAWYKHQIEQSCRNRLVKQNRARNTDGFSKEQLWNQFWQHYGYDSSQMVKTLQLTHSQERRIERELDDWAVCANCRNWRKNTSTTERLTCSSVGKRCEDNQVNDDDYCEKLASISAPRRQPPTSFLAQSVPRAPAASRPPPPSQPLTLGNFRIPKKSQQVPSANLTENANKRIPENDDSSDEEPSKKSRPALGKSSFGESF